MNLEQLFNAFGFTPLEGFAVIFTLACVALTVVRNVWCWPLGIIGVSAYFFLFYENKLYSDMGLQVVFFVQSVYGWYFWVTGKKEDIDKVPIRTLNPQERWLTLGIIILMIAGFGLFTDTFTDTDVPYIDAMVASISLVANMLLARKVLDNWALWIFADTFYVGLFIYKELYLTAGLYVIFFFMATAGLISWRKEWKAQKV